MVLRVLMLSVLALTAVSSGGQAQAPSSTQTPQPFGGTYETLDARRQKLVENWVGRFNSATGQNQQPGPFYDDVIQLSVKTTFEAITHALMTTRLTDAAGTSTGDALDLIEYVNSVRGKVIGAPGDHQFRMYVRLTDDAVDMLGRSKEFTRGVDNMVYHKGYPMNYRGQGGTPSIQFSVAPDRRFADVDVDYRSSGFPAAMFNGHLTASNSDVRAGRNYQSHIDRWTGFQNWWGAFFGFGLEAPPDDLDTNTHGALPSRPRAGDKKIDVMVNDFLNAWLVEGDTPAAVSYVSSRAYACLSESSDDPVTVDRGMAPFRLMRSLKAAHDQLGPHQSLQGLTVGVRLSTPGLKLVKQPRSAQFEIYNVPDDVAARFECENRLNVGAVKQAKRDYGKYYGATFVVDGPRRDTSLALLWARDGGFWKIVSWQTEAEASDETVPDTTPTTPAVPHLTADTGLVQAAKDFFESWLIRKDYDRAFRYISPKAYACYNLNRDPHEPAAASLEDAGQRLRSSLERSGTRLGAVKSLGESIAGVEPVLPVVRVLDHPYSREFALTSLPNNAADIFDCAARTAGSTIGDLTPEYGKAFGSIVRFHTSGGDAPVLRLIWVKEPDAWRITVYGIDVP